MQTRPRPPSPARRRSSRSGFALIITVTLLAFLVLLLVSLASLTRVETQVASNSAENAAARQSALMALNIALGQLQLAAGPDQRVTAPAVFGETPTGGTGITAITARDTADNGLVAPVNGTRHWTGVWGNKAAPESIFTAPNQPVLLRWLVSGNETGASPIASTSSGQITSPTAAATMPFNPTHTVLPALSATTQPTAALTINSRPAALLLGSKTAGADETLFVAAPLVEISSDQVAGLSGANRVGRYAWWVGDEGVKAKYNLPDPYIANATPDSSASDNSRDSRYRLLSAQRFGIEKLPAFNNANYPLAATAPTDVQYTAIGKTLSAAAIRMASPGANLTELPKLVHELTTHSFGVLANSQFGGLRRDLTFHLDPRSGDTFLDGRNILPDGPVPLSAPTTYPLSKYDGHPSLFSETTANGGLGLTTLNVSPRLGPKWDQLKSYYKTAYDHPVDLEIQPAVDIDGDPSKVTVQAGISPVILETRHFFALRSGPAIDTSFIFVIGNPYTRPLKASNGLNFRLSLQPNNYSNTRQDSREWGIICNHVGPPAPGTPTEELASNNNTQNQRQITGIFTRYLAGDSSSTNAWQQLPLQNTGNPNTRYHPNYYPLLKFPATITGDGPADPDLNYPGLLDRVFFQIPPGVLDLAPGEAKAYKLDPTANLPSETVNGDTFQVWALQEMSDSFPTYVTRPCDPRFINPSAPPGILAGGALEAGADMRVGMTRAATGGINYSLTVPGKPNSVLQRMGWGMTATPTQNGGTPNSVFEVNVFGTPPAAVGAGRVYRLFGNNGSTSAGAAFMATHAETSMLGSFQVPHRFDAPTSAGVIGLLRTQTAEIGTSDGVPNTQEDEDAFVKNLDDSNATQAAWGQGHIGSPLRVAPRGKFTLNDIPASIGTDEIPVHSLAQFNHFDLTADDEALGTSAQPAYAVGNSRYNRLVPRAASRTAPQDNNRSLFRSNSSDNSNTALGDSPRWYIGLVPELPKKEQIRRYDIAYLLNTALWDDVFFSTVRPASGSDATLAPRPANRRLIYTAGSPSLGQLRGSDASDALPGPASLGPGESGRASAAQMLVNGSFNINSTSTHAWIALLSGLRGLGVNTAAATTDRTPASRSIRQTGATITDTTTYTTANTNAVNSSENTYTGFRSLTDTQIATLATEIVKQIKARGPFLSLSQFINRHLTPAAAHLDPVADTGLSGALQQAIDRAGLNTFLNTNSHLPIATGGNAAGYPDESFMPTGAASGISSYMAMPAWLNQADLLQSLGPVLSARSDTFVIRTYGEVIDPINSPAAPAAPVVKGRAWCEAIVQRLPDYVDNTQRPTQHPSVTNTQNQNFGRRFHIVSFRWLSPDDI